MTAVADTSVLVAAINRRDRDHARSADALRRHLRGGVVVTAAVAVEVGYLVGERVGRHAARAFLDDLDQGRYLLEPVDARILRRAVELDRHFADLEIGLADGTVVAAAERHRADAILSLDDHYRMVAPAFPVEPAPGRSCIPEAADPL